MFRICDGVYFYPERTEITGTPDVVVVEITGKLKRADTGQQYSSIFVCYGRDAREKTKDEEFEIAPGIKFQGHLRIRDGMDHLFISGYGALIREGHAPYEGMFVCYGPLYGLRGGLLSTLN